jgi:hypothetical protein
MHEAPRQLHPHASAPTPLHAQDDGATIVRTDHDIYQLLYCSVFKAVPSVLDIDALVSKAQSNNLRDGITGMLMLDAGLVIQWLEGPRHAVRALWARLLADPRHHCIVELIHRDYPEQRLFPDWTMRHTSRTDMLAIVRNAHEVAQLGMPSPWSGALASLTILLEPEYAKTHV